MPAIPTLETPPSDFFGQFLEEVFSELRHDGVAGSSGALATSSTIGTDRPRRGRLRKGLGGVSAEENKRLAREGIRVWTTGDFGAADEIYAPTTSTISTPIRGILRTSTAPRR
jgi:hypothetical protein